MNEKQRHIIESLRKDRSRKARDWDWLDYLTSFFGEFVKEDIELQSEPFRRVREGVAPRVDVKDVLGSFYSMALEVDLTKSPFTIEQMLHLIVVDFMLLDYRSLRRRWFQEPYNWLRLRGTNFVTLPDTSHALGSFGRTLVAATDQDLTPSVLAEQIVPYIEALRTIQKVSDDIRGYHDRDVIVRLIKQSSPFEFSLEGAADAVDSLKEDIVPWRRKNAQRIANLKASELEVEIEKKKAEADQIQIRIEKEEAETEQVKVDTESKRWEIEQKKVATEKMRFELKMEKFQLALEMVSKLNPDLSYEEKITRTHQMLASVETLTMSELEFSEVERPKLPRREDTSEQ